MAAKVGRDVAFTWGGAQVDGVREKGLSLAGEPINVTSDEDNGWQTLLEVAGENAATISLSGVSKSTALQSDWFAGTRTRPAVFTYPDGTVVSGTFFLASYNEGKPYNDAVPFDAELQSSGPVTRTPGAAPTNSVLPAIAGIAEVDEVLTALEGVWAGAASFTYQWELDGTPIVGATGKTYTVVAGDVGKALTVSVTGVNGTGSLTKESAATADVVS